MGSGMCAAPHLSQGVAPAGGHYMILRNKELAHFGKKSQDAKLSSSFWPRIGTGLEIIHQLGGHQSSSNLFKGQMPFSEGQCCLLSEPVLILTKFKFIVSSCSVLTGAVCGSHYILPSKESYLYPLVGLPGDFSPP